jgi:hypothetical protein
MKLTGVGDVRFGAHSALESDPRFPPLEVCDAGAGVCGTTIMGRHPKTFTEAGNWPRIVHPSLDTAHK